MNYSEPGPGFALVIGLDRSDQKVDLCQLAGAQSAPRWSTVSTSPEALRTCFEELRASSPAGRIGLCLEAPAGNLLAFFASHAPWLEVYPVNPLTLKRFRETFVLSRANDDGKDALYLARLLQSHSDQLRRWQPEDPATARLQQLVAHRRAVIDERTALTNRLKALLKGYFPQALILCGEDLWRPLALGFLRRWPSLQALRKARAADPEYLVPVQRLSARFRSRVRNALRQAAPELYARIPQRTWRKPWVVHSQFAGRGAQALSYLARYVSRTALSSKRLLRQDDRNVTLSYRDSKTNTERTLTLAGEAFLHRFLQHVLPKGFRRVRTYGWLSPAAKKRFDTVRTLLNAWDHPKFARATFTITVVCPQCQRAMRRIADLRRNRGPPELLCAS